MVLSIISTFLYGIFMMCTHLALNYCSSLIDINPYAKFVQFSNGFATLFFFSSLIGLGMFYHWWLPLIVLVLSPMIAVPISKISISFNLFTAILVWVLFAINVIIALCNIRIYQM